MVMLSLLVEESVNQRLFDGLKQLKTAHVPNARIVPSSYWLPEMMGTCTNGELAVQRAA